LALRQNSAAFLLHPQPTAINSAIFQYPTFCDSYMGACRSYPSLPKETEEIAHAEKQKG
jgi:hypothetical protein